ncbi:hypothetical protein KAZ57_00730 [Patescibacteria group bacterium]|nr:hypothetical protein [Patescibacteria group bacterium]
MSKLKNIFTSKNLCVLSFVSMLASLMFQMFVSNSTVTKTDDFKSLYNQKETIKKEIAYLEYESSELTSISSVEKRAIALGFTKMTAPIAMIKTPPLAALNLAQ